MHTLEQGETTHSYHVWCLFDSVYIYVDEVYNCANDRSR